MKYFYCLYFHTLRYVTTSAPERSTDNWQLQQQQPGLPAILPQPGTDQQLQPSLEAAVGKVCRVWRSSLLPSAAAAAAGRLPSVDSSVSGNPKPGGCSAEACVWPVSHGRS